LLDDPVGADEHAREPFAADVEVLLRALRLRGPVAVRGHLDVAEAVRLGPGLLLLAHGTRDSRKRALRVEARGGSGLMHDELKSLRVKRRDLRTPALYLWSLFREFKGTLAALILAVLIGGTLYAITPHKEFDGNPPPLLDCFLGAWLALFAQ